MGTVGVAKHAVVIVRPIALLVRRRVADVRHRGGQSKDASANDWLTADDRHVMTSTLPVLVDGWAGV
jgi:hypothetical protein